MADDFIAQHRINAPGSYAGGYMRGDTVAAQVVSDWGLRIPDDVTPADDYRPARPADDDSRATWEAYVTARGTSAEDASAASLDELRGMYEPDPEPDPPAHDLPANAAPEGVDGTGWQNATTVNVPAPGDDPQNRPAEPAPERPADSARKDAWVEWAVESGADPQWARDPDTTKDELKAWEV